MADLYESVPVSGQIWVHTKSKHRYRIIGSAYNGITDRIDVVYEPLYDCEFKRFTRQIIGHDKAFLSTNDNGEPRFTREK